MKDDLEKDNDDKSVYYSNRVEFLFESEYPAQRETIKACLLTLLGDRFINVRVTSKKHQITDVEPEKDDIQA